MAFWRIEAKTFPLLRIQIRRGPLYRSPTTFGQRNIETSATGDSHNAAKTLDGLNNTLKGQWQRRNWDGPPRCSILSRSPSIFASGIFTIPIQKTEISPSAIPLVVLFVTPGLTGLLGNANGFIPNVLPQAFQELATGQEIDVLAAVVDRISYPPGDQLLGSGLNGMGLKYGSEGVSMLVGNSGTMAPDLWSPRDQICERETVSVEQRCSLTFTIQPPPNAATVRKTSGFCYPIVSKLVELPLANTLFQSGQTSTLFAQQWVVTETRHGKPRLKRVKHSILHQQNLELPHKGGADQGTFDHARYTLLTPPQIVTASMGNIIRRFQVGDDPGNDEPASKKLEESMSLRRGIPESSPFMSEVWAQVTPRELWSNHPQQLPSGVEMIKQGYRFHRVLSGGGGWGNKEGLLSLDPDSTFYRPGNNTNGVFGDGHDSKSEERKAFGEVVRPGDAVRFLSFEFKQDPQLEVYSHFTGSQPLMLIGPTSFRIGTIPSTTDKLPDTGKPLNEAANMPDYMVFKGHFGALSETGMSVEIKTYGPEGQTSHGALKLGIVTQTKVPPRTAYENYRPGVRILGAIGKQPKGLPLILSDTKSPSTLTRQDARSDSSPKEPLPLKRSAAISGTKSPSRSTRRAARLDSSPKEPLPLKQFAAISAEKPQKLPRRPLVAKQVADLHIKPDIPGNGKGPKPLLPWPHPQHLQDDPKDSSIRSVHLEEQEAHPSQETLPKDNSFAPSPSPIPETSEDSSDVPSFLREVEAEREARMIEADEYFGSGEFSPYERVDEVDTDNGHNDGPAAKDRPGNMGKG